MMRTRQSQQGFIMVAAIFLLVALAALGAFMVTMSTTQHLTSAQDVQGSRAYWAARAGMEWAAASINSSDATRSACHATTLTLDGFSVSVSEQGCIAGVPPLYNEAGITRYLHRVVSTSATAGNAVGRLGYIERSISATMDFCTPESTCEK